MYSFPSLEPVCCSMFGSNCCFLTCISQGAGQVVWYFHLFQNFPQYVVIHTLKGFGIVNKAQVDAFLELSCFIYDTMDVGNWISGSTAFSKSSLNIWKFPVHVLLKPGLDNFEHYFTNVRWVQLCGSLNILWHCLWYWNESWLFQSCGHCWVFQICWHIRCSTFTTSSLGFVIVPLENHHLH